MAADFDIPREIQMPFFTPSRLPSTQLFSDRSLSELFEELTARINQQIDKIDPEPLLQTPVQDTVEYVIDGTRLQVPTLMYDNRYQLPPLEVKSTVQDYGSSIESTALSIVSWCRLTDTWAYSVTPPTPLSVYHRTLVLLTGNCASSSTATIFQRKS